MNHILRIHPFSHLRSSANLPWEKTQEVSQNFKLLKKVIKFEDFSIDDDL